MTLNTIAQELRDSGLCIFPQFFSAADVAQIRKDLLAKKTSGHFHRAGGRPR